MNNNNGHTSLNGSDAMFLHYASKYYDPVKAREYYLRNRELKGRRSARNLDTEGKEVWRLTKTNITSAKKVELERERLRNKATMDNHRASAKEKRESISEKLRQTLQVISDQKSFETKQASKRSKKEIEDETKKLKKKKESLNKSIKLLMEEDYSNLPEAQRIRKIEERKKRVEKLKGKIDSASEKTSKEKDEIREDTAEEKADIRKIAANAKTSERDTTKAKREQLSNELKQTLDTAREAYKQAKESIKAGYETTFQAEFDKIAAEFGSDSTSSSVVYAPPTRSASERKKIRQKLSDERKKK